MKFNVDYDWDSADSVFCEYLSICQRYFPHFDSAPVYFCVCVDRGDPSGASGKTIRFGWNDCGLCPIRDAFAVDSLWHLRDDVTLNRFIERKQAAGGALPVRQGLCPRRKTNIEVSML